MNIHHEVILWSDDMKSNLGNLSLDSQWSPSALEAAKESGKRITYGDRRITIVESLRTNYGLESWQFKANEARE